MGKETWNGAPPAADCLRFVARQPIFDASSKVCAYELLFRSGFANAFGNIDGTSATAQVMAGGLMSFGLDRLTGGKPAFINVNVDVLERNLIRLFPPGAVVAEILEDVEPTPGVIAACQSLRSDGYRIALDDVIDESRLTPFRSVIDVVKVDLMGASEDAQASIARSGDGLRMLAEKVETREDMERTKALGYTLFQGYFFAKPEVLCARDVPRNKLKQMEIIRELHQAELNLSRLEKILRTDVELTYRLLRFINSAGFGLRVEVNSIERALRLLEPVRVRRWATLVTLDAVAEDKPRELLRTGLVRAKLCETLAPKVGMQSESEDLFLVGLFSVLEPLFDVPLTKIVDGLALSPHIKRALTAQEGKLGRALDIALHYESGNWADAATHAETLGATETDVANAYLEAVAWTEETHSH